MTPAVVSGVLAISAVTRPVPQAPRLRAFRPRAAATACDRASSGWSNSAWISSRTSDGARRCPGFAGRALGAARIAGGSRAPARGRARPAAPAAQQIAQFGLGQPRELGEAPAQQRRRAPAPSSARGTGGRRSTQRRAAFGRRRRMLRRTARPAGIPTPASPARSTPRTPPCRACGRSRRDPRRRAGTGTPRSCRRRAPAARSRARATPPCVPRCRRRSRRRRGRSAGTASARATGVVAVPERGDRVFDAVLRERDDVHVALDDDDRARVADRVAREKEPVELAALREQRRLRRIEVLGLAVAEHAAAEADHLAAAVVDREHDPVAEPVVALAAIAGDHEPGGFERRVVVAVERRGQRLPGVGRVADAESRGDRAGEAALLQVVDRARRVLELRAIELRGVERQRGEIAGLLAPLGFAGPLDARAPRARRRARAPRRRRGTPCRRTPSGSRSPCRARRSRSSGRTASSGSR